MQNSLDTVAAREDEQYVPVHSADPNFKLGTRVLRGFGRQLLLLKAH